MKKLILDFFRRWWWMAIGWALLEFMLGLSIANDSGFGLSFEFWAFQLALWPGAIFLSIDLQRGVARAVAALPLTTGQIGRSWWLATVGLPALAATAMLFLGAGTFLQFRSTTDVPFPADRLATASLFSLLWLGSAFPTILPTPGRLGTGSENRGTHVIAVLSMIMLFGSLLFAQNLSENRFNLGVFLGLGAFLTVVGWLRAGRLVVNRASFRVAALRSKDPRGRHRAPEGSGGIPFLLRSNLVHIFPYVAAMVVLLMVLMKWREPEMAKNMAIVVSAETGSFLCCGFILLFQLLPFLRQMRFLRTLPISSSGLAAVVIAVVILPLLALGVLAAGFAWLTFGHLAALQFLESHTFILAPASLCVFFAVWLGNNMPAHVLLIFTLFGSQRAHGWMQMPLNSPESLHLLTVQIVVVTILLAFLLTRRALMRGGHAYRVQANPFGNFGWGTGSGS